MSGLSPDPYGDGEAQESFVRQAQRYAAYLPSGVRLSEATKAQIAAAVRQARYKPCGQPGEHGLAESGEPVTCAMSAHWAAAGHKPWCGANAATPWVAPASADARCCPLDTRNAANRP